MFSKLPFLSEYQKRNLIQLRDYMLSNDIYSKITTALAVSKVVTPRHHISNYVWIADFEQEISSSGMANLTYLNNKSRLYVGSDVDTEVYPFDFADPRHYWRDDSYPVDDFGFLNASFALDYVFGQHNFTRIAQNLVNSVDRTIGPSLNDVIEKEFNSIITRDENSKRELLEKHELASLLDKGMKAEFDHITMNEILNSQFSKLITVNSVLDLYLISAETANYQKTGYWGVNNFLSNVKDLLKHKKYKTKNVISSREHNTLIIQKPHGFKNGFAHYRKK